MGAEGFLPFGLPVVLGAGACLLALVVIALRLLATAEQAFTPSAHDAHRAVMTMWYETQLHLDKLEREGVDVTAVRRDVAQSAEMILQGAHEAAAGLRPKREELRAALAAN